SRSHHSHNFVRLRIELDGLTYDVSVAAKDTLPRLVGENCLVVSARLIFLGAKILAENRARPKGLQPLPGDVRSQQALRQAVAHVVVVTRSSHRGRGKHLLAVAHIGEIGQRHLNALQVELVIFGADGQKPARIGYSCRMEKQAINYAEDGGIGSYAQRQGEHRHDGESWRLAQAPNAEFQ